MRGKMKMTKVKLNKVRKYGKKIKKEK